MTDQQDEARTTAEDEQREKAEAVYTLVISGSHGMVGTYLLELLRGGCSNTCQVTRREVLLAALTWDLFGVDACQLRPAGLFLFQCVGSSRRQLKLLARALGTSPHSSFAFLTP